MRRYETIAKVAEQTPAQVKVTKSDRLLTDKIIADLPVAHTQAVRDAIASHAASHRESAERRVVEWRPAETAPKDGTRFDVWDGDERIAGVYWHGSEKRGDWWAPNMDYDGEDGAFGDGWTHWLPIPAGPIQENTNGE